MALQSELEPGLGPSWDPEGPVNAGIRQGSIVRKLSMQEVMERGIDDQEAKTYPASVQEVLEQSTETAPSQLGTGSEELDRYAGSVFGIERAIANGEVDPYDAIKEEIDRVANSDNAAEDIYNRTNARAAELVVAGMEAASAASSSDEQLLAAVEHLRQFKKTTEAPWGFEVYANTVLNGLVALEGVEGQRIREERIFQDYTLSLAGNKYQETSKVGVVWDFTKLLVLPGTTFAMGDFVKNFNGEFFGTVRNALGEIVGRIPEGTITGRGFKAYQNAVKKWWELPARDRLVGFPALNEHINDIAGSNVFVYMAMIQPFIEKESITDLNFDYHVDTATLLSAGVGTPVAKALKFAVKVRNYRKPISILIRSGETERAGALIARALKDRTDEARRITGMTKDELAWSAYPLDVSEVGVVGQIRGAAAEAAKSLEDEIFKAQDQVNKVFREITDPSVTPLRYYFDEAAMAAKRRQVLGDLNDYPNMARVVDMDDAGFTVEVTSGSKYAGVYDADTLRRANAVLKQNLEDATESLETIRQNIRAQHELDAYTKTPRIAKMLEERDRAAQALMHIRRRMDSDQALLDSEEGSVLLDKIQNLDARIARAQARADRSVETAVDEAFLANSDAERLRKQLIGYKEQIKRNEKIIKDLEKPPKVRTERVQYTFKEDGTMDVETLHDLTIPSYASPSQVIDQLLKGTTDKATLAEFIEAKILTKLYKSARGLTRGLTPSEHKAINQLLIHGDEQGRVFSVQELIHGVETRHGLVKLKSTKAIATYAGIRRMFDEIHRIKDLLHARSLTRGGYRQLLTKMLGRNGMPLKVFAKPSAISKSIPSGVRRLYDHKAGQVVDVDSIEDLAKRLEGEWQVVQFRHGQRVGDEVINYGLVRFEKDMKPISGPVLSYHPGYVPRVRPGVFYVVAKRVRRKVDGVDTESYQTHRLFSSKSEAYEYYAGSKDPDLLEPVPDKKYRSTTHETFDDEWDDLNFGGLYTGERTDRTILQGIAGTEANRMSAYKALSNYMAHIANRYATQELRQNLISRFQQTYGKYLYKNGIDWRAPIITHDTKVRKAIESARKYIEHLIRVPTAEQRWWQQKMQSIAEMMEGVPLVKGKPREWVMNFAASDPTAVLRAITFHQYLGMFNPAQWFVQGMGAAVAISAYPGKAFKLLPQNLALRAAWYGRKNPEAVRKVADAVGVNGDWLVDVLSEVERTGLFDSLKTTADYNASINGISLTASAVRRLADAGLFFFREGEQMTRGYGYLLARDLFMKGKPKNYKLTQKDIDFIAADSLRFTLNLNRANAAVWQKGILSIPTQFWQVIAKFYENLIGGTFGYGVRRWSNAEKIKIMTGHFAMFGMAGVPLVESITNWALNAKKEATDDPTAMTNERLNIFNGAAGIDDQDFARLVQNGVLQTIAYWVTGADPELSSRFSIPAGAAESWEMFAHGDRSLTQAILGAAGPGLMRWYDAIRATGQILGPLDWDTVGPEQFRQVVMEWAKVYSTTRNAEKADWWHTMNRITNSKGQTLMDLSNMTEEEFDAIKVWQALGFGPAKVGWMYDLERDTLKEPFGSSSSLIRDIGDLSDEGPQASKRVSGRVDAMVTIWNRFKPEENPLDTEQKRAALNQYFAVAMEGLSEEERIEFYKKFMDRILADDKSRMTKVIDKALLTIPKMGNAKSTTGALFNPLLP